MLFSHKVTYEGLICDEKLIASRTILGFFFINMLHRVIPANNFIIDIFILKTVLDFFLKLLIIIERS